jgi:hypothetical protein
MNYFTQRTQKEECKECRYHKIIRLLNFKTDYE